MPTNANAYNSRVTDEALEKRFRDTFRAQGGSELVNDLYASGVIVPVVDFTAAAEGSGLPQDLQQAWDFTTGYNLIRNATVTIASNAGFWKVDFTLSRDSAGTNVFFNLDLTDGLTSRTIYSAELKGGTSHAISDQPIIVFLRAGDSLTGRSSNAGGDMRVWARQVATSSGDPVNPSGFTPS